jgi:hypothetical protein
MIDNDEGPSPPAWWPKTMTPAEIARIAREGEEAIKALPQCYQNIAWQTDEEFAARLVREHSKDWDFFRHNPERRHLVRRPCFDEQVVFDLTGDYSEGPDGDATLIAVHYLGTRLEMKSLWAPRNLEPEALSENFCQILFDGARGGVEVEDYDPSDEDQPQMSFIAELDEVHR